MGIDITTGFSLNSYSYFHKLQLFVRIVYHLSLVFVQTLEDMFGFLIIVFFIVLASGYYIGSCKLIWKDIGV